MRGGFTFILILASFIYVSAQDSPFPNELSGFKFFGEGKLNGFQMGKTTKKDVEKVFASTCEKPCDYDSDWKIEFWYFDERAYIESYSQGKYGEKFDYKYFVPAPERLGTIRSVTIHPKKSFPFLMINFPKVFERMSQSVTGEKSNGEWEYVSYDTYRDELGLTYSFWNDDQHQKIDYLGRIMQNGDLVSIEYEIPDSVEKTMFVQTTKQ